VSAHANVDTDVPAGPAYYLFENAEGFRDALGRVGFDPGSFSFKTHLIQWQVPTLDFVFEAERNAGVRTAGVLARQTPEALEKIRAAIAKSVQAYSTGDGFAIPKAAYIVAATKDSN
jgi:hypothetical protein